MTESQTKTEPAAGIAALHPEGKQIQDEVDQLSRALSAALERVRILEVQLREAHNTTSKASELQQRNQELERKLRFANERKRDIAGQLQQIWDSPTWRLLNRLHNSRLVGGTWRGLKTRVPERWKECAKRWIRGRANATQAEAIDAWSSDAEVLIQLEEFLARVDGLTVRDLVVFVAGVKFVESEGQRVTQIVRELVRNGVPVLMLYFRWQNEYQQRVPRPHDPLFFQMPMDLFERHRTQLIQWPYRPSLQCTCVFEFPPPQAFQWVNEFSLAGWKTVYDIIDDWEEFHHAGKAVWYEPAVEQYLCANCNSVSAIVPLLAQKAERWVPGLKVVSIPNGVSPDSFDMDQAARPLRRGQITVGYFGYLTPAWFDWSLLTRIAARRPEWQFHIVGYGESLPTNLPDNVQLLGKVPHHLLYGYAQNWDVGIVPFKPSTLSKGADPIKVYEYLTLGLPVVTTEIPHLKDYPGVFVAASEEEFELLIEEAATKTFDKPAVSAFIKQSTWHQRGLDLIEAGRQGTQNTLFSHAVLEEIAS